MIHHFDWSKTHENSIGVVQKQVGSVIWIKGMTRAFVGESVVSASGIQGVITRVNESLIEAIHFFQGNLIIGEKIAGTGESLSVSVGEKMVGHVFDALGYTYGGKEDSKLSENRPIEMIPGNISERSLIKKQLETGLVVLDTLVPIAKGQRELILGDTGTGKSTLARQVLINHVKNGGVGVICLLGKQRTEIEKTIKSLEKTGVMKNCVVIAEPADSVASRIFVSPFTAMTVAEFYRDCGSDVLLVIDDLSTHANRYREISLYAESFPGRDSYPADIFWTHARLLERAGSFAGENGSPNTITCLPIVETVDGNLAGYIETNLMSMTDGHILLDKELMKNGHFPAVNHFLSVTRVGRQTQTELYQGMSQVVLSLIKDFDNLKNFLKFGYDLNENAQKIVCMSERLRLVMNQESDSWYSLREQLALMGGVWTGKDIQASSLPKDLSEFKDWNKFVIWCYNKHA